jgi:hypothetical protein
VCVECKAVEARAAQCAVPFIIRVPALLMAVMPVGSLCRESDGAATAARARRAPRARHSTLVRVPRPRSFLVIGCC